MEFRSGAVANPGSVAKSASAVVSFERSHAEAVAFQAVVEMPVSVSVVVAAAVAFSRALRQSAAASLLIATRRPSIISRGPKPWVFHLKYIASLSRCAAQNSLMV